MAYNKNKDYIPLSARKMTSRRKRIEEEQQIHNVTFAMLPSSSGKQLENIFSALYGVPGIGKSKFAEELAFALQKKHQMNTPGAYFIQCEPINHPWSIRQSYIPTWPTFRKFIDDAEADRALQKSVKLWIIDTIDGLIPKGISTISHDFDIVDLRDEGWAGAWHELRSELQYQLLRLQQMAGVLILSHERGRKTTIGRIIVERPSMDLSDSIYNMIGDLCSVILHMRPAADSTAGAKNKGMRSLVCLGNQSEDAKDNLGRICSKYSDGIVNFKTEKEAVQKILTCFDSNQQIIHKKVKKVKKKKKKKAKRK